MGLVLRQKDEKTKPMTFDNKKIGQVYQLILNFYFLLKLKILRSKILQEVCVSGKTAEQPNSHNNLHRNTSQWVTRIYYLKKRFKQ